MAVLNRYSFHGVHSGFEDLGQFSISNRITNICVLPLPLAFGCVFGDFLLLRSIALRNIAQHRATHGNRFHSCIAKHPPRSVLMSWIREQATHSGHGEAALAQDRVKDILLKLPPSTDHFKRFFRWAAVKQPLCRGNFNDEQETVFYCNRFNFG